MKVDVGLEVRAFHPCYEDPEDQTFQCGYAEAILSGEEVAAALEEHPAGVVLVLTGPYVEATGQRCSLPALEESFGGGVEEAFDH